MLNAAGRPLLEVAAGVLWREGRCLAAQRPVGSYMAGFWEFPGGKLEKGESPEQALARELEEELAVRCLRMVFWRSLEFEYPKYAVLLHFFHVPEFAGEPVPQEGQSLCWIDPREDAGLEFLPVDIPLLRELRRAGGPPRL